VSPASSKNARIFFPASVPVVADAAHALNRPMTPSIRFCRGMEATAMFPNADARPSPDRPRLLTAFADCPASSRNCARNRGVCVNAIACLATSAD
jgi:hypothetical protein